MVSDIVDLRHPFQEAVPHHGLQKMLGIVAVLLFGAVVMRHYRISHIYSSSHNFRDLKSTNNLLFDIVLSPETFCVAQLWTRWVSAQATAASRSSSSCQQGPPHRILSCPMPILGRSCPPTCTACRPTSLHSCIRVSGFTPARPMAR